MTSTTSSLTNSFPGPRLVGVACILAPALLIAGVVLMTPPGTGTPEGRLAGFAADPVVVLAGVNLFLGGAFFAVLAAIGLARLIAPSHPHVAGWGGFLVVAWAVNAGYFGAVTQYDVAIATTVDRAAGLRLMEAFGIPAVMAILGTLGLVVGWGILAYGAYRADVLGAPRAAGLALMFFVPPAVLSGYQLLAIVPFLGMAAAFVPLGLTLLRGD